MVLATLLSLSATLLVALLLADEDELVLAFPFPFDLAGDRERERDCSDKYSVTNWPTTGLKMKLPLRQA